MTDQTIIIGNRTCHIVSDAREAECVIIKPLGEFERLLLVDECIMISKLTTIPFVMYAFEVNELDLRVEGADATRAYLMSCLLPEIKRLHPTLPLILGGYSLGGLFALHTSTTTDAFMAIMAGSPSLWIDGWNEYADAHQVNAKAVYMSVGNKEANTRKGKYSCIAERIQRQHERHTQLLGTNNCALEINEGGHFADIEMRKAKGFAWCMKHLR